ncbi:MAG: protein translocase subunit SecD [Fimbriimonadaceae bacterium]
MRQRSLLFLAFVLALTAISAFLAYRAPTKYGLDVRGGVRFTFQMDLEELTPDQRQNLALVRSNLTRILQDRASQALGVAEATVQTRGADQFIVELPGETDIDRARQVMSTTAKIVMYHARNVTTPISNRRYEEAGIDSSGSSPFIRFRIRATDREIGPDDPEYQEMMRGWEVILEGEDLARAEVVPGRRTGEYIPQMRFSAEGSRKIERWSRQYTRRQEMLASVLDGRVLSIAPLREGAIISDNAVIEGTFDTAYVRDLVNLLNAGSLPVSLEEIRSEKVDPTIGDQALGQIMLAGYLSFFLIAVYLIAYYVFPGIVALTALVLYALFTIAALKTIGATWSLAAIGGFILSVGMAVDANVLVFERLKEELRSGKTLQAAVPLSFKRALPAIVDSNTCTIITSLVLMVLGTGPVKGFATVLLVGVVISLFTAVVVTRALMMFLMGMGIGLDTKKYGLTRQWFGEKYEQGAASRQLPVVERRNTFFIVSTLAIVPGILFIFLGGIKPNVEFQGGVEGVYTTAGNPRSTPEILRSLRNAGVDGANVKLAVFTDPETNRTENIVYVTAPIKGQLDPEIQPDPVARRAFLARAAGFDIAAERGFTEVGPSVSAETRQTAINGVLISISLIVVYLAIRFGFAMGGFAVGLRFSAATIGALLHDFGIVFGLAAVMGFFFGWEISALFITAMLTVVGYSTHDTIVIFDRIRENLRKAIGSQDLKHIINVSVTQSIARSINTSATVIVALLMLVIFGSATVDLRFFNLVMLAGILVGTYSSIFNAAPILYLIDGIFKKRGGEAATLVGISVAEQERARVLATTVAPDDVPRETPASSYGQVKRRRREAERGTVNLDD